MITIIFYVACAWVGYEKKVRVYFEYVVDVSFVLHRGLALTEVALWIFAI